MYNVNGLSEANKELCALRGSLISAFVNRFLKRIICKLATGEISMF